MDAPSPTRGWVFWFIASVVLAVVWLASPSARADEPEDPEPAPAYIAPEALATEPALPESLPACPSEPLAYEGEDQVVGELRAMRLDLRAICLALVARQDQQLHRSWWTTAQLLDDGDRLRSRVISLLPPIESIDKQLGEQLDVVVKAPDPLPVEDAASLVYAKESTSPCGAPCKVDVVNEQLPVADSLARDRLLYAGEAVDAAGESNKFSMSLLIGLLLGLPVVIGLWWLFHRAS